VELGRNEANKGLENISARVVAASKAAEVAAQIAVNKLSTAGRHGTGQPGRSQH